MRTYLTLHNVQVTSIHGVTTTSTWRVATVKIFELPEIGAGGGRSLCGCYSCGLRVVTALIDVKGCVGIYPGEPQLAGVINMCTEEWRCEMDEVPMLPLPFPYPTNLDQNRPSKCSYSEKATLHRQASCTVFVSLNISSSCSLSVYVPASGCITTPPS